MAFDATLTVSDGTSNHVYEIVDMSKPFATLRQVDPTGTQLDLFDRLHIAHTLNEKTRVSNSKVAFSLSKENATTGKIETAEIRMVGVIPRATFGAADIKVLMNMLKNFLGTSGYQDKIINMES